VRERHLFSKVQDEHRTARRGQRRAIEQLEDRVVGCRDLRCGKIVEPRVIDGGIQPALPLLQIPERCAAGDAERPGAKQFGLLEPIELPRHDEQHVLQDVVGVIGPNQAGNVAAQGRLNAAQQQLERVAIPALRAEHPFRFLSRRRQRSLRDRHT
jgi:hypothetical protein